jgi:hypothetical protein
VGDHSPYADFFTMTMGHSLISREIDDALRDADCVLFSGWLQSSGFLL